MLRPHRCETQLSKDEFARRAVVLLRQLDKADPPELEVGQEAIIVGGLRELGDRARL